MNSEKITQNVNIAESLKDIGARLQTIRLQQELDLNAVFQKTKIPIKHLKSIESGDLDALPELVYVRGFVRRYAQGLHQDVESFDLGGGQASSLFSQKKRSLSSQIDFGALFQRLKYPLYALLVVGVGSGLVYLNEKEFSPAPAQSLIAPPIVSQSSP